MRNKQTEQLDMIKARWNGSVIAESENTVKIEGNHYFSLKDIKKEFFQDSDLHSICPYKGQASYYTIVVDGKDNKDAAWYYPSPKRGFEKIENRVAFWRGVEVSEE